MQKLTDYLNQHITDDSRVYVKPETFADWLKKQPYAFSVSIYQMFDKAGQFHIYYNHPQTGKFITQQTNDFKQFETWYNEALNLNDDSTLFVSENTPYLSFSRRPVVVGAPELQKHAMDEYLHHIGQPGKTIVWGVTDGQELNQLVKAYNRI